MTEIYAKRYSGAVTGNKALDLAIVKNHAQYFVPSQVTHFIRNTGTNKIRRDVNNLRLGACSLRRDPVNTDKYRSQVITSSLVM